MLKHDQADLPVNDEFKHLHFDTAETLEKGIYLRFWIFYYKPRERKAPRLDSDRENEEV